MPCTTQSASSPTFSDNEMESLRQRCMSFVVKHGLWQDEILPEQLLKDIRTMDNEITRVLSGRRYYQYHEADSVEFDIVWSGGKWGFDLRNAGRNTASVSVGACAPSVMTEVWAALFGLDEAGIGGDGSFKIEEFKMDTRQRKVTFHGTFADFSAQNKKFATEFFFSKTCFFVRIKCTAAEEEGGSSRVLNERCFEKPDTPNWFYLGQDDRLHNPSFCVPLFDKYR